MSLKISAVNRYGLRRSFMNIPNCPWQVIRSFTLLNFKSNNCFLERTVKIQSGSLKSRIDACQKNCASLKDSFYSRLHLDTNIQVKEIKVGLQQTGTFLLAC
jgi:hypothetical protein